MTEEQWLAATDAEKMLGVLRDSGRASDRKLRLFACSVCRQLVSFVGTEEYVRGIEVAEAYADGGRMKAAMKRSRQALKERMVSLVDTSGKGQSDEWKALFLGAVAISERQYRGFPTCLSDLQSDRASDSVKKVINVSYLNVRDVFGNPFRSVTADSNWLTSTVVSLAQGIYDERAFDRLPILADALEDAGCRDDQILGHLRSPGPHVRGCWILDLLLGKS
jgi:hypothetical protein